MFLLLAENGSGVQYRIRGFGRVNKKPGNRRRGWRQEGGEETGDRRKKGPKDRFAGRRGGRRQETGDGSCTHRTRPPNLGVYSTGVAATSKKQNSTQLV